VPLTLSQILAYVRAHQPTASRPVDGKATVAAVLVPLILDEGRLSVLLTKRTDSVEHHKGQISFPGGTVDKADAGVIATALREAEEEIGLSPASVEVIGRLDEFEIPTGFSVTPVVGLVRGMPDLVLNLDEVVEAFIVPVGFFLDAANEEVGEREWKGRMHAVYSYQFGHHRIWGATAAMIRSLLRGAAGLR
jgi:8-oxo-dGTP pyrophosphatase MutT (NUDIX family)